MAAVVQQQWSGMYPEVPEEAKTEGQILAMVDAFRMDNEDYNYEFMEKMVESYGFWDKTRQWWEKVQGQLTDLKQQLIDEGKPALTKNIVFPLINLVCGIQSQEPVEPRSIGRTKEDTLVAEGMSECIKWTLDKGKFKRKLSRGFFNASVCGRGWVGMEQVPDDRNMFGTRTLITAIDPGEIMYDRKSTEYDLSDCDQLQRTRIMSRSQARLIWPDKVYELNLYFAELDGRLDTNRLSLDRISIMRRDIAIMETWYRTYELLTLLLDSRTGDIYDVSDIDPGELRALTQGMPQINIFKKRTQTLKLARSAGAASGVLLDHQMSPYEDLYYPYIPVWAYRSRDWDFGIVEQIKDPQREVNKRASQYLQYLNTMPKTRLVTDDEDAANKFEQGQDIVSLNRGSTFQIIQPPQISVGHAQMEEISKDDAKRISGINDNLQGLGGANEPGIVVSLRQRQGLAMIALLFDNLEDSVELAGQIAMSRVRQFMEPEQVARIIGPDKAKGIVMGPDGWMPVVDAILSRSSEEYDLVINRVPSSPSVRLENAAKIEKLLQLWPAITPLIGDIAIDAFDLPQKEEIESRLEAAGIGKPPTNANQMPAGALPPANTGGAPVIAQGG